MLIIRTPPPKKKKLGNYLAPYIRGLGIAGLVWVDEASVHELLDTLLRKLMATGWLG